jgi:hypothetical protein
VAFEASGEFEFEQNGAHLPRRRLRRPHEFIDRHRRRAKKLDDASGDCIAGRRGGGLQRRREIVRRGLDSSRAPLVVGRRLRLDEGAVEFGQIEFVPERHGGLRRQIWLGESEAFVRRNGLPRENVENVFGPGAERRAVAQEVIGSFRARIERRTRNGEDFAALIRGEGGRDERARAARRLDNHDSARQPRDDAVAAREIPAPRLPFERHFADRRAVLDQALQQTGVIGRIDIAEAAPSSTAIVPVSRAA